MMMMMMFIGTETLVTQLVGSDTTFLSRTGTCASSSRFQHLSSSLPDWTWQVRHLREMGAKTKDVFESGVLPSSPSSIASSCHAASDDEEVLHQDENRHEADEARQHPAPSQQESATLEREQSINQIHSQVTKFHAWSARTGLLDEMHATQETRVALIRIVPCSPCENLNLRSCSFSSHLSLRP